MVTNTPSSDYDCATKKYVDDGLAGKQATISDLTTIRSGASAGATAVQPADLLSKIYPVGSVYYSTTNTSPASFLGGTWTQILNNATIPLDSTFGVKGNGKALGFTGDGSNVSYLFMNASSVLSGMRAGQNPPNVGTTWAASNPNYDRATGISTDTTKSGMVATASSTLTGIYAWKRTA